jgi:hypothetical protein
MSTVKNDQPVQAETQQKYFLFDYRNIEPMPATFGGGNVRDESDYGDLQGDIVEPMLARHASGEKHLILKPVQGFRIPGSDKVATIDGHRRIRGCKLFHEQTGIAPMVRVMLEDLRGKSEADIISQMIVHSYGRALSPLSLMNSAARLSELGKTPAEIAVIMGRPKYVNFVRNLLLLSKAPSILRDRIKENVISYSQVIDVLKDTPDYNTAVELIENALAQKTTAATKTPGTKTERVKITKADLKGNTVDSIMELKRALAATEDRTQCHEYTRNFAGAVLADKQFDLRKFADDLLNNRLTKAEIEKLLYV